MVLLLLVLVVCFEFEIRTVRSITFATKERGR
jgi:hypothetical protein